MYNNYQNENWEEMARRYKEDYIDGQKGSQKILRFARDFLGRGRTTE